MKYDKLTFSPLFEKTLVRFISEFDSDMNPTRVMNDLTKVLKRKVSNDTPGGYNIKLSRDSDGKYILETAFSTYRDSRLLLINLFKWIERNGSTEKHHNMYIDIKFIDSEEGPFKGTLFNRGITIEKIDKLKMVLDFNESKVYDIFPSRRYGFNSKSVGRFEIKQKFIPKEDSPVDPKFYSVPETSECGINFETLNKGFLRLQYVGGKDYNKKPQEILDIISEFCVSAWNCTFNTGYTKENILAFETIVKKNEKIRESYRDFLLFKKNFPSINFTVDLLENPKTLDTFYQTIRDRIFDLLSNIEFKGEMELNYDTTLRKLQIRGAKLKCNNLSDIEFVSCEIEFGNLTNCDLYDSTLVDAVIKECNLFLDTNANRCKLINSFCNRTTTITNCEFEGFNGVLNGKMEGGIFRNGAVGVHAEIDKNAIVIEYKRLKPGYMVAGDKIIIPTKKFDTI